MSTLLVLLIIAITFLSIVAVGYDSNKDKQLNQELRKHIIDNGWNYLDAEVFASGKIDKDVIWKIRKEEGEAIWFIDNVSFPEEHLWILARKKYVPIDYSSSIAQFFLTLSHGRDEAKKLANLQETTINKTEFNNSFVVLATDKNLAINVLTDNVIDLLLSWCREKNKPLPKIMLSKKGLEIKINQSSLDFSLLTSTVELGRDLLKAYTDNYIVRYKSY